MCIIINNVSFPVSSLFFLIVTFSSIFTFGQQVCTETQDFVHINELYFTNQGPDPSEGLEIAGVANTDLSDYRITIYDGNTGNIIGTPILFDPLNEATNIPNEGNGFGALWKPIPHFDDINTLGISLFNVTTNQLVQFISVGGVVIAQEGDAVGEQSEIISFLPTNPVGTSLQQEGGEGRCPDRFSWVEGVPESRGTINVNQEFGSQATKLIIFSQPLNCVRSDSIIEIEVCAFDEFTGLIDSNFTEPFEVDIFQGQVPGFASGAANPVNGCGIITAQITLDPNDPEQEVGLGVSSPNIPNFPITLLEPIRVSQICAGIELITAVIDPCGNDRPNEMLSAVNGDVPVDIRDIRLSIIDPNGGPLQPDVITTWSSAGTEDPDNVNNRQCGLDLACNRIITADDPDDLELIEELQGLLNDVSEQSCPNNLVAFQFPQEEGIIPPNAKIVFFLGAGGNGNIASGFDDAINNLDFSVYCGQEIYPIFAYVDDADLGELQGEQNGLLDNNNSHEIIIKVNGGITSSLIYDPASNPGLNPQNGESITFSKDGTYQVSPDCIPIYLFDETPLEAEIPGTAIEPGLTVDDRFQVLNIFPNPTEGYNVLNVFVPVPGKITISVADLSGKVWHREEFESQGGEESMDIDISDLSSGMYMYHITYQGAYISRRMIKI